MGIQERRIGIIGAGNVGSHVAFALATQGEADEILLNDLNREKAEAEAMDIEDAVSYLPHHVEARYSAIEDMGRCDILIIAAGALPQNDQSRLESLGETVRVMDDIIPRIQKSGFAGIIIGISNPADVIVAYLQEKLQWPVHKILSTGTALDSARLQKQLSRKLGVNRRSLTAYAMGEHGFSAMIPWSHVYVAGKPLAQLLQERPERYNVDDYEKELEEMKQGGYLVLKGKGCTEFGIATCTVEIVRAIFHDEHKILPCSVYLDGEYGQEPVFASVPAMLGKNGVEEIIEIHLTEEEQERFNQSTKILRQHLAMALGENA